MRHPFPLRSILAGLVLGLLVCLPLGSTGCNADQGRRLLDPIHAERQSMEHTKTYAKAYVEKFPAEKVEVDDFYASWDGRLKSEEADAPDAPK